MAHIALVVRDYDEALAFYVGKLGFKQVENSFPATVDRRYLRIQFEARSRTRCLPSLIPSHAAAPFA